ncbi:CoxG family protein [Novosphingobium sp. G106]|uniref:CoxG family protein n=1 Tax=Novosphingobium sp. G106 TaxID=2849500 RepID=UPI0020C4CD7A|nr:SRPBCC domain-containing protein [Novosphingobium sp. G106]
MSGQQFIAAARDAVWIALNDPAVLRHCIPGCQLFERIADDRMNAVAGSRFRPIAARFNGEGRRSEVARGDMA